MYPSPVKSLFKNTMGTPFFFTLKNIDQNPLKIKFRIKIWTFSFQNWFWNQLSTSESNQTKNTQIHMVTSFSFTTSQSQKLVPKADFKRGCLYFYSIFFWRYTVNIKKNGTYGRQSISQPMLIVTPIPKNPTNAANNAHIMLIMLILMVKMQNWLND